MIGLPKPGERVTFSAAQGHRVPVAGRPGSYYRPGEAVTEVWTYQHHARLTTGALVLIEWPGKPAPLAAAPELEPSPEPAGAAPPAAAHSDGEPAAAPAIGGT